MASLNKSIGSRDFNNQILRDTSTNNSKEYNFFIFRSPNEMFGDNLCSSYEILKNKL
jgi:hypothetical protein